MSDWNSGPPPSLGWWPCSAIESIDALRWWDGNTWSRVAWPDMDAETAAARAAIPCKNNSLMGWRHRPLNWPSKSYT